MFRNVIVGYDATEEGRDALALGGFLAGESADRIVAAAVTEDPNRIPPPGYAGWSEVLLESARKVAARAPDEGLVEAGVLEPRGAWGTSAAAALHALAVELDADLLIVGSTHRGPVGRVLGGSTATRLLNGASCPVAAAPRGFAAREHRPLRLVGVAYDGSPESRVALEGAGRLAAEQDASMRVFTVVPPVWPAEYDRPRQEIDEIHRAHYAARLDDALDALPGGVRPEGRLLRGEVEPELIEQASDELDVMVVGSRGYGPLRRVLVGSTASALMRDAGCPVMVYPRGTEPAGSGLADEASAAGGSAS